MKLKDDPKIKAVTWFLELLNDDVDAISEMQLSHHIYTINHYCTGEGFCQISDLDLDYDYKEAREFSDLWKKAGPEMMKKVEAVGVQLGTQREALKALEAEAQEEALKALEAQIDSLKDDLMEVTQEAKSIVGRFLSPEECDLWKDVLKEIQIDLKKVINKIFIIQHWNLLMGNCGTIRGDSESPAVEAQSLGDMRSRFFDLKKTIKEAFGAEYADVLADGRGAIIGGEESPDAVPAWLIISGDTKFQLVTDRKNLILDFYPYKDWLKDFPHVPHREGLSQSVKITFCWAVNGLPIEAIKSCKECEKYFLHLSKKPRYFCSTKCGSRYANRERRKDPEEYEKYKAEQRERYYDKVAEEQGRSKDKIRRQKKSTQKKKEGK